LKKQKDFKTTLGGLYQKSVGQHFLFSAVFESQPPTEHKRFLIKYASTGTFKNAEILCRQK